MPQTHQIHVHAEPSLFGSAQDQYLPNEDALSVAELIPQILQERKSFLNISEALIAEEIAQTPTEMAVDGPSPGTPAADTAEDDETTRERFQKQKAELLAHLGLALNETSLSLDFVSLLMSAEKPRLTKLTISPHLLKTAPLGSLSADRVQRPAHTGTSVRSVGMGWKYQALRNVTLLFRGAAALLSSQVAAESRYWQQVSTVLAHGEVLYKTRDPGDNTRALGVRYGYGDSGLTYHDKGHAVLRKHGDGGDVVFCPVSVAGPGRPSEQLPRNRYTRVRVLSKVEDDYMVTGELAQPAFAAHGTDTSGLIRAIERARYFLFEDDLFFHLVREAKQLISYNVTIIADKIVVDAGDQIVEFEAAVWDEAEDAPENTLVHAGRNNDRAQSILLFLRLMLCGYFQYRLRMRHKMPTLHTKWKQANSHPLLLRPLLGHTRHQRNFRHVVSLVARLNKSLGENAAVHAVKESMYANLDPAHVSDSFVKAVQRPVSTVSMVLERVDSHRHLEAVLEVTTTEIFVDLVVRLTVATYNSRADLDANKDGSNVLLLEFTDLTDVGESLEWTLWNFLEDA